MTTNAPARPTAAPSSGDSTSHRRSNPRIHGRQTIARAIVSEWIKIWTLRSTWITSLVTIILTVLFGAGIAISTGQMEETRNGAKEAITSGLMFGQIAVAVLGSLVITGEYSSGQIRSSLAAVPRRGRLLLAKASVLAVVSFILGALSTLLAWAISRPFLGSYAGSPTDWHYLGHFWGSGLAFAGISLMALGLGVLMRSTAGSITITLVLLFVIDIPLIIMTQKWAWAFKIMGCLPRALSNAVSDPFQASTVWAADPDDLTHFLQHGHAVLAFAAWAIVPLVAAWFVFSRRDA